VVVVVVVVAAVVVVVVVILVVVIVEVVAAAAATTVLGVTAAAFPYVLTPVPVGTSYSPVAPSSVFFSTFLIYAPCFSVIFTIAH
jgi:hypothetical protein